MSTQADFCDAEGVPILNGATVRQIGVWSSWGAFADRYGQEAVVLGRGGSLLLVRFAGNVERMMHPLMLRVVSPAPSAEGITLDQIADGLRCLLCEIERGNIGDTRE